MPAQESLHSIVADLLGTPYAALDCWALVRHVVLRGRGIDLDTDPHRLSPRLHEVWWQDDDIPPWDVAKPWDAVILAVQSAVSDHIGLIVDTQHFLHTRKRCGACLEPVRRWVPRMLQIVRLPPDWA